MSRFFASTGDPTTTPSLVTLTAATHGGWTQIPYPKGVEYNGALYFGDVNGSNGNIELYKYVISTATLTGPTVLHAALQQDTHAAPAVLVRSDGKIVAAYSAHNDVSHLYVWISTNAEDISAGTETNIDASFGSDTYTYANLVQLSGESNKLYLFVRSQDVSTSYLQMSTSTNGGATWAAHTDLFAQSGDHVYWKIADNGTDRIDFTISSDDGDPVGLGNIYHFYYNGTYRNSAGTSIGSPTFDLTDLTLVYNSSDPAWPTDIILDGSTPRIVYNVSLATNTDSKWGYAYWTGSAWTNVTVLSSVGFGVIDPSPVAALDAEDPDHLYAVRYIGGHHQLWRYTTISGGASWDTGEAIGSGGVDNIYPTAVKNHVDGHPAVLWLFGTYTADTSNSVGVKATT